MATRVLNEDRTARAAQLIDQFVNTQTFRVVGEVHSLTELVRRHPPRPGLCGPANPAGLHARPCTPAARARAGAH